MYITILFKLVHTFRPKVFWCSGVQVFKCSSVQVFNVQLPEFYILTAFKSIVTFSSLIRLIHKFGIPETDL